MNLKHIKILFWDYGNYVCTASRLGREDGFGEVYYYVPKVSTGYPTHKQIDIGRGVPNITVISEWSEVVDKIQGVFFADSHEPEMQEYFVKIGKVVFGSRYACKVEHDRKYAKELMAEIGLPVNKYYTPKGMDELEELLKKKDNLMVKNSLRGDMESWKHKKYVLSKDELLRMRNDLGAYYNQQVYTVEELLKILAEIGWDGHLIDGYPIEIAYSGIEVKDCAYLGRIIKYEDLPKQLRAVTTKFIPIFKEFGYRGAYSNEVIIDEKLKGYLIDTTARLPQPNTDLAIETYTNYPQMVWDIMNGVMPTPEYKYEWGVQFIIKSELAKKHPSPVLVPDEYKNNVKLKNLTIDEEGTWYYTPLEGIEMSEIGSVVCNAATIKEAFKGAEKIAKSLEGFDIEIDTDCLEKAYQQIDNLKKAGIDYLS